MQLSSFFDIPFYFLYIRPARHVVSEAEEPKAQAQAQWLDMRRVLSPTIAVAAVKHDALELLPTARRPVLHVRRPVRQQGTSDGELNRGPPVGSWSRGPPEGDKEGTSGNKQRGACGAAGMSNRGGGRSEWRSAIGARRRKQRAVGGDENFKRA